MTIRYLAPPDRWANQGWGAREPGFGIGTQVQARTVWLHTSALSRHQKPLRTSQIIPEGLLCAGHCGRQRGHGTQQHEGPSLKEPSLRGRGGATVNEQITRLWQQVPGRKKQESAMEGGRGHSGHLSWTSWAGPQPHPREVTLNRNLKVGKEPAR